MCILHAVARSEMIHKVDLTGDYETNVYDAARRLLAAGADPVDTVETYRGGKPSMTGGHWRGGEVGARRFEHEAPALEGAAAPGNSTIGSRSCRGRHIPTAGGPRMIWKPNTHQLETIAIMGHARAPARSRRRWG
jgi:hypothetical protein